MISRRQAFAVPILSLLAGLAATRAQATNGSSPVSQFDVDHDKTVDIGEAKKAASDLFDKLDSDKDGTLSIKELHGRLRRGDFSAADRDNDRTVSKDEYLAVVVQRFMAADADRDGTVSAEEFRTPAGRALARLLR
jgi:EF-hand domain pair